VVVVHQENPVKNLTLKQLEGIFTGQIENWSEVGGKDLNISVYTRNTTSGTYKSFQKLAMSKKPYGPKSKKLAGGESPASEVAGNPGGISYVGLAYAGKKGVQALTINGVLPKPKNCLSYPLSRKLYYLTAGEPEGRVKSFLQWACHASDAHEIIRTVGFIPNPAAK